MSTQLFGVQTRFVSKTLNSASNHAPSPSPYRSPLPALATPFDCLHPVQVAKVGHTEDLGSSISVNHQRSACDIPARRAIFDACGLLAEAGEGLAVGAWVDVSWMEDKVRFRPSYRKSEVANHFVYEPTLCRFGSGRRVDIFIAA